MRLESFDLEKENSAVSQRLGEMENYSDQLSIESKLLKEKITDYESQNNELDNIVHGVVQDIADLEN